MKTETSYVCEYCNKKHKTELECKNHEMVCDTKIRNEKKEQYHIRHGRCCGTCVFSFCDEDRGLGCTKIHQLRPSKWFGADLSPIFICDLYETAFSSEKERNN